MPPMKSSLIADIDAFLAETGIPPYRFGLEAAHNGRLVERLRDGRRVWPETEKMIRNYMRAARRKQRGQPHATA